MSAGRPNILVFMTDQQRGSTVLGDHPARTPRMDAFRAEGVTFTSAFCPSPHCCPSRASFFTGLYPTEHGVWHNVAVQNAGTTGLQPGVRLWTDDLADAGYDLHWAGKWHVSFDEGPADRGFHVHSLSAGPRSESGGFMGAGWDEYRVLAAVEEPAGRIEGEIRRPGYTPYVHYGVDENPFGDQDHVNAGIAGLKAAVAQDDPWVLYVGPLGPHDPYRAPRRFVELYDPDEIELPASFSDAMADKPALYRKTRAVFDQLTPQEHRRALMHYYALCSYEDELFGQVLDALDRTGQRERTIVLFVSDHGDYTGDHGLWCKGLPCFRGAYHVPAVVRWPVGVTNPGREVAAFVSLTDFAPTFLETAGIETDRRFTGSSLLPFLRDETPVSWRSEHYTQSNGNELYGIQRAVFDTRWKFVYNGYDYEELYDLEADPEETENLYGRPEYDEVVRELSAKIWRFGAAHQETCINPYIMVGLAPYGPAQAFSSRL